MSKEETSIKIPAWKYKEVEVLVAKLYKELQIKTLPIDPFEIIKNRGYKLIPLSQLGEEFCGEFLNGDIDAFSLFNPQNNEFIIIYDDDKPFLRLRFTLMHEVGHIELGHMGESELARKLADYFAGYSLAPTPLMNHFNCDSVESIMAKFQVSKPCAEARSDRYFNWLLYCEKPKQKHEKEILELFNLI